jgi:hypothetical protein
MAEDSGGGRGASNYAAATSTRARKLASGSAEESRPDFSRSASPVIRVGPHHRPVSLPSVGDVLWVAGHIHDPQDKKAGRLSVVASVPKTVNGRITIITRTTNLRRPGVASPKGGRLRFTQPGVWGHRRTVEGHLWLPPDVGRTRGTLDKATLDAVLKYFRIRGYQK